MPGTGVLAAAAANGGVGYVSSVSGHTLTDFDSQHNGPPSPGMKWDLQSEQWVYGDGSFPGASNDSYAQDVASGIPQSIALGRFNLAQLQTNYRQAAADIDNEIAGLKSSGGVFLDDLSPGATYTAKFLAGLESKAQYKARRLGEWLNNEKAGGVDVSALSVAGPPAVIVAPVYDDLSVNSFEAAIKPADAGVRRELVPGAVNAAPKVDAPTVADVPAPENPTIDAGRVVGSSSGPDPVVNPPAGGMAPWLALLAVVIIGAMVWRAGRS